MAHTALTAADLKAIAAGGLIAEDVLRKVFDISPKETPYLDVLQGGSYTNPYHEWVQDSLSSPALANAAIDGADISASTTATGARVGNHGQISYKTVKISTTTEHSDVIGRTAEEAYQTMKRLQELRNDQEATALSNQGSQADDGESNPGKTAGLGAWLETNVDFGTGGSAGGFNTSTKLVEAPTPGEARALTWEMISDCIEDAYLLGAKPTKIFSRPEVTKRIGQYLIKSPYFVKPVANIGGSETSDVEMSGYVDTFRTDFGYTMQVIPSRNMQKYTSDDSEDVCALFGVDPEHIALRTMWGVKVETLGKKGLSTEKMITTNWSHDVLLEKAHFGIFDLLPTAAVTDTTEAGNGEGNGD